MDTHLPAAARASTAPRASGNFELDREAFAAYWRETDHALEALPPKPKRNARQAEEAAAMLTAARAARTRFLTAHIETLYRRLTADLARYVRLENMIFDAATLVPGLVPTREAWTREMALKQADKEGVEVDQGLFVARLMAVPALGAHLCHAMQLPRAESLERLDEMKRTGRVDLGKATVERKGAVSIVTMRNPEALNAEDDSTMVPFEMAADLALLDPETKICLLRGGPVPHPKYAGKHAFGAGINLTDLYWGRVPYLFYLVRDLGFVNKMYRGLTDADDPADETVADTIEKMWVAAVEEFAIGGHCQILLVMDYILAAEGAYLTLPARKEGIIPGLANLRLPRFIGDRLSRQAVMYERRFDSSSPEARLIFDEVVPAGEMDAAIERVTAGLTNSGVVNAAANRRAFRIGQEPTRALCEYLAVYAREQAYCHTSPALVSNLERFWNAANRRPKG
ncbi:MAG: enoyl-CoA hydratase/isomerase family protein [Rhodospirillaceae bacterium]|nr:enoyl-CoA hydratase/isomerase family protein [Rhodospirillaceae bacterium]